MSLCNSLYGAERPAKPQQIAFETNSGSYFLIKKGSSKIKFSELSPITWLQATRRQASNQRALDRDAVDPPFPAISHTRQTLINYIHIDINQVFP
jgi:hypothetical protein